MIRRFRAWRRARALRCRIDEEWQGSFIGRRFCSTHNVVWDDGGNCPRAGRALGQPFAFAWDLPGDRR